MTNYITARHSAVEINGIKKSLFLKDSQSQRKMNLEFIHAYPQSKVLSFILPGEIGIGFIREMIFEPYLD